MNFVRRRRSPPEGHDSARTSKRRHEEEFLAQQKIEDLANVEGERGFFEDAVLRDAESVWVE